MQLIEKQMGTIEVEKQIVDHALKMGADLAGIADAGMLKSSPSHRIFKKIGMNQGAVGSKEIDKNFDIQWPENALSALVIAVAHPVKQPELDWWQGKGTLGNDKLIAVNRKMKIWIEQSFNIKTWPLPYHIESGGIFLKDAAVLAGLGCIGKSNMLVTPEFGPRIRFRAMLLSAALKSDGPSTFNPCSKCDSPCRSACPQKAFDQIEYTPKTHGMEPLPSRDGSYSRNVCGIQMTADLETGAKNTKNADMDRPATKDQARESLPTVKFCRACEFACPTGR